MKKANRSTGRPRRRSANRAVRGNRSGTLNIRLRWLAVTCTPVLCLGLFVASNGAEQVDSGWAVATPSPIATGSGHNGEQDLVIRHVLEQTQQPLLRKPPRDQSPTTAKAKAKTKAKPEEELRFAERPETTATDGWRPAGGSKGPSLAPAGTAKTTTQPQAGPAIAPAAPAAPARPVFEFECDCSGPSESSSRKPEAARLQSSGPALPPVSTPVAIDDAPVANSSIEEATKDDAPASTPVESATAEPEQSIAPEQSALEQSVDTQANEEPPVEGVPVRDSARVAPPASSNVPVRTTPVSSAPPAKAPSSDITPVQDLPPLSRQMIGLKNRVRTVLKGYYRKALSSKENDPWEAMHGMLAYGVHSRIHEGGTNGQLITSVGWLCYNKPCKGQTLLYVTPSGELRAKYGVGLQGHLGQFLAMLAQCHVSPDYPIHVGDHEFTIKDLIEAEKKTCYPKSELTFKLIALQHYGDLNDHWVNDQGVEWDFSKLISEELAQPIRGAACGGTHRLSGLSLVVKARLRRGEPLDGEYQKANDFVKKYQQYAFRLQNRDGSLSTSWFRGAGDEDDINRRIKTTGHILEWLCYSLSDEQLREPQTVRAVTYLANLMYSNYDNEWEIGPRSHATHALLLYDQRVFQPYDKEGEMASYRPSPMMAKRNQSSGGSGMIRR